MPASSNFNQAIREAQTSSIVGPNVVQKALPYVGIKFCYLTIEDVVRHPLVQKIIEAYQ